MFKGKNRRLARQRKRLRVRQYIVGTSERPRLNVYRSLNHIYAQIIDDTRGVTLLAASTLESELKKLGPTGNVKAAKILGQKIAERALNKGINKVVFDRGGYIYHGRIAAVAEGAREAGLEL